jgi:hypothetical protein
LISQNYLQGMMSGLSPNALCRIFQYHLSIQTNLNQNSKLKVSFDAIKKSYYVTGGTVRTKPLRMYGFHQQR